MNIAAIMAAAALFGQSPCKASPSEPAPSAETVPARMSPAEFKRGKPAGPAEFRCHISLSDSYAGSFEGRKKEYHSAYLVLWDDSGKSCESFLGYADRESPAGWKLNAELGGGAVRKGYATVKYRPGEENDKCVEIVGFRPDPKK